MMEVSSNNEWIVEDEEPCSSDDPNWPDGDAGDKEYLDVAVINNIGIENEDKDGVLAVKKQRVDGSSPTMQKGKGIGIATKVVGIKDYADLEDANIVLEEDDLVVLG
ncbi:uncharacterized protein A4U43_C06F6000 [Asparagus officinalis]|uniref:Uncharacterized protein n=1 Tax=Asparagus officinalis TaxID=4686 RepID=A0A5P1EKR1_ASPOF|nr:uncharacterized protein A4U43_C06F6000 [Asparagus officinalis]